jgi:hypothetical protein
VAVKIKQSLFLSVKTIAVSHLLCTANRFVLTKLDYCYTCRIGSGRLSAPHSPTQQTCTFLRCEHSITSCLCSSSIPCAFSFNSLKTLIQFYPSVKNHSLFSHCYHQTFSALSGPIDLIDSCFHFIVTAKLNKASTLRLAVVIQDVGLVDLEAG